MRAKVKGKERERENDQGSGTEGALVKKNKQGWIRYEHTRTKEN